MKDSENPWLKRLPTVDRPQTTWNDPFGNPRRKDSAVDLKVLAESFMRPLPLKKLKKRNADDPNEPEEWG